jgi:hypothetical protein
MAIRSLVLVVLLVSLASLPVQACFGPKLFVGVGHGGQNDVIFALVTLYIQEKTGVESKRIEIEMGQDPLALLFNEKADLVIMLADETLDNTVFHVEGLPLLATGKRLLEELQFTTVLPAIRKLNRLLKYEDVARLASRVDAGESAMAVAREFFMEHRWI